MNSVTPYSDPGLTWWRRLEEVAPLLAVSANDDSVHMEAPKSSKAPIELLVLPELLQKPKNNSNMAVAGVFIGQLAISNIVNKKLDSLQSRIGQAMHRLLEWVDSQGDFTNAQAVAAEFSLTHPEAEQAAGMAQRILLGEGAWAWDPAVIDWQSNEVELSTKGQFLRLDRLVQRADTGEWWVLDYKSESQPQHKPELVAQMQAYIAAVQACYVGEKVRAAFLTGSGHMIEVTGA